MIVAECGPEGNLAVLHATANSVTNKKVIRSVMEVPANTRLALQIKLVSIFTSKLVGFNDFYRSGRSAVRSCFSMHFG